MRIGLYGGTFDPIHHGHLILARDAVETCKLDRMIFIPCRIPPHKPDRPVAPATVRLEMLRAAIADELEFEIDDFEIGRKGASYSITTALEMRSRYPNAELLFFIGEDNVPELESWRNIRELEQIVEFAVFCRTEHSSRHPYTVLRREIDISSTEIRKRVADGKSIRYHVPEAIGRIIEREGLYRDREPGNP